MSSGFEHTVGVLAVRIYFREGDGTRTPMADILTADHVKETIQWTDVQQRARFESGISGYTLFYDERPKRKWEEWETH